MQGQLSLTGSLQAPQGQLMLSGERLAFGDPSLRRLQLDATLDARQQARIGLNLRGIRVGDTYLGRLQADGSGDHRRQVLQLSLQGPLLQLALAVDGSLGEQGDWRGRIASGRIQSGGQDWQLQQPASLERLASGRLNLGAHCWQSGDASLCGAQQRLVPEPKLDWRLENFPWPACNPGCPMISPGKGVWTVRSSSICRSVAPMAASCSMPVPVPCASVSRIKSSGWISPTTACVWTAPCDRSG